MGPGLGIGCGSPGGLMGGPGSGVGIGSGPGGTGRGSTGGMVMSRSSPPHHHRATPTAAGAVPYAAGVAEPGVMTMAEVATLAQATVRLVRRRFWLLLACFCFGWTGHEIGLFVSALLGSTHAVLANLIFVLAVVVKLASLVLMVHVLRPALELSSRDPAAPPADPGAATLVPGVPTVPDEVFVRQRPLDVLALGLGPFLAVYAVWGFIDDEVGALFRTNYLLLGLGDVQNWSISVNSDRLTFYLLLAAAGWVLRAGVQWLSRRRAVAPLAVAGLLAEGVWSLSGFIVLVIVVRAARDWLRGRVVWADLTSGWDTFLGLLPDFTLPFGPTVRELAQTVVQAAPGAVLTVFGLPLMWLALTATVYGWRDYRARDLLTGTRLASRLERLERAPVGSGRRLLLFVSADLRTKYLPVAQALRLIGRAGPRFVGAYLLLATAVTALDHLLTIGVAVLAGPHLLAGSLLLDPLETLLVELVVTMVSVALYAAAFDRAVNAPARTPVTVEAR